MIRTDRWHPRDTTSTWHKRPEVGQLVAIDFRAWRVLDIDNVLPFDPEDGEYHVGLEPLTGDGAGKRHMVTATERKGRGPSWEILSDHYSVCGECGDLQPCREQYAERVGTVASKELARYDQPGVCPACEEPITLRQKSIDLPNVVSPLGGIVTFHRRWKCLHTAAGYEQRVLRAGAIKALTLSCKGRMIEHRDGVRECLGEECPGVDVWHNGDFMHCVYRSHGCPRFECNFPVEGANV